MRTSKKGFTIVELLVVIVIIGILATITIVSYNGIVQKSMAVSLVSDLNGAAKILKLDQSMNGFYPSSLSVANDGKGIAASDGASYQYEVDNSINPQYFCITETKNSLFYRITNDGPPAEGVCPRYGLIMDLDAGNLASYPGSGVNWLDLSGNSSNATLNNGVTYSVDGGGSFSFDGVNDSASIPYSSQYNIRRAISFSIWIKRTSTYTQSQDVALLSRPPSWYFYDAYNSGFIRGDVYIDGTRRANLSTPVPFDGSWYQIVYTYDSNTKMAKLYKNGVTVGSITLSGLANYLIDDSNSNFLSMGASNLGRTMNLNGLRIYNRALSDNEVLQDYNMQRSRYGL